MKYIAKVLILNIVVACVLSAIYWRGVLYAGWPVPSVELLITKTLDGENAYDFLLYDMMIASYVMLLLLESAYLLLRLMVRLAR